VPGEKEMYKIREDGIRVKSAKRWPVDQERSARKKKKGIYVEGHEEKPQGVGCILLTKKRSSQKIPACCL